MATPQPANLARIRQKVRNVTGRLSANDLSDTEIDQYINDFYMFDFQEMLHSLRLNQYYEFVVDPNMDIYDVPQIRRVLKAVAWVAGFQLSYHQDPESFYRLWPFLNFNQDLGTGDGLTVVFSGTAQTIPILRTNVMVSDGVENFQDDGSGNMISSITDATAGSVNYLTGAVSVTFQAPPAVGTTVQYGYVPYYSGRPTDVLFYNQQLIFRPVPDQPYPFRMEVEIQPDPLVDDADVPLYSEWWETIAYGASIKIFADNGDFEMIERYQAFLEKQQILAQRRTLKQLANQRTQTVYSTQNINPWGQLYPFV